MPYITQDRRDDIDSPDSHCYSESIPKVAGELNYKITQAIIEYMLEHGLNYQHINDVLGALEGCKLEFYNRVAVPYEKKKIRENEDVYPPELLSLPEERVIDPELIGNINGGDWTKLKEVPGRPGMMAPRPREWEKLERTITRCKVCKYPIALGRCACPSGPTL